MLTSETGPVLHDLAGGACYEAHGVFLRDKTADLATTVDAILFGAEGGSGWDNPANAYDGDNDTFAGCTLSSAAAKTQTWTTFAAATTSSYRLTVLWSLGGLQTFTDSYDGTAGGGGGTWTGRAGPRQ